MLTTPARCLDTVNATPWPVSDPRSLPRHRRRPPGGPAKAQERQDERSVRLRQGRERPTSPGRGAIIVEHPFIHDIAACVVILASSPIYHAIDLAVLSTGSPSGPPCRSWPTRTRAATLPPGRDDPALARTLVDGGKALDLPVQDHIVPGGQGAYVSVAARGPMWVGRAGSRARSERRPATTPVPNDGGDAMNWELVAARLTAAFTDVRLETSTGRVLVAKEPVDFRALPQEAAETDEEEIDLDAFVVEEFLASRRPLTPLLDLEWHASHLTLHAFDAGDHRLYLGQPEQDDCIVYGHRMVAALEPRGCPVVCSAFFTDLVRTNGRGYGADLFGSLPETTINHVPHPVPRRVVLDAHWGWMQEVSPDLWLDLFDIVVKEPAPQDVFQVSTQKHGEIRRLAGLGPRQRISARHISGSLAHLRSEVARMPLDLRRWVLETSLERTYREG